MPYSDLHYNPHDPGDPNRPRWFPPNRKPEVQSASPEELSPARRGALFAAAFLGVLVLAALLWSTFTP